MLSSTLAAAPPPISSNIEERCAHCSTGKSARVPLHVRAAQLRLLLLHHLHAVRWRLFHLHDRCGPLPSKSRGSRVDRYDLVHTRSEHCSSACPDWTGAKRRAHSAPQYACHRCCGRDGSFIEVSPRVIQLGGARRRRTVPWSRRINSSRSPVGDSGRRTLIPDVTFVIGSAPTR